ncbi:hypothetical protein ABN764_04540 [Paenibacillaceae sp. P-4]|uniref:hypothetical protein n=1 Tax=Paenibacillaceae bacterium P-4 TaxID=3160969 RepID=UPI0032E81AF2
MRRRKKILSNDLKETYKDIIESAIIYANQNLKLYSNNELSINYEIKNGIFFNAQSLLYDDKYSMTFYSEFFERIFAVYNTLLNKGNFNFYKIISYGDQDYTEDNAQIYLDILFELSSKIFINHELGHIFNGHLKYKLGLGYTANKTIMFLESERNELPPLESQVLEMDADAFAATRIIGTITFNENISYYNSIRPNLIKNKSHSLLLTVVSATIVFSILGAGKKRSTPSNLLEITYLPLRTRQDYYLRCALNAYKYFNPNEPVLFDIVFLREVIPNIEQYVNLYNHHVLGFENEEYCNSYNLNELNEPFIKHCDYLDYFWTNTMREKLIPYSYYFPAL